MGAILGLVWLKCTQKIQPNHCWCFDGLLQKVLLLFFKHFLLPCFSTRRLGAEMECSPHSCELMGGRAQAACQSSGTGSAGHAASNIPLHCWWLLWDGLPSPGVEWKPSPANDHRRKRASVFFRLKIAFQPVLEVVGDHWTQFYGCIAYEATDLPLAVCFRIKSVVDHLNLNRLFMKIVANPFWSALDLRGKIWIIMLS